MKQNRLKSKVMWFSIGSALFMIYNSVALNYELPTIPEGSYNILLNALLGILVAFGIVNNPTSSNTL